MKKLMVSFLRDIKISYEEIADTLAIPLGTVKAQLFRARELLLNILQHTEIANENGKN